jgi:hypothetical protein
MLSFICTIASIAIASYQGWRDARPKWVTKTRKVMSKRRWVILGTTAFAIFTAAASSFSLVQELLTPAHIVTTTLQLGHIGPNCNVASLVVYPSAPIKSLHLVVEFNQPILTTVVQSDFRGDATMAIQGNANIHRLTCDINSTASSEPNPMLSFAVSSDRRAVLVNGHDLTRIDGQSYTVTMYSDTGAMPTWSVKGKATFEASGLEVPATIKVMMGVHDAGRVSP